MNDTTKTKKIEDEWIDDGSPYPGLQFDVDPEALVKYLRIQIMGYSDPSRHVFEDLVKKVQEEEKENLEHYFAAAGKAMFNDFICDAIDTAIEEEKRREMEKYEKEYTPEEDNNKEGC